MLLPKRHAPPEVITPPHHTALVLLPPLSDFPQDTPSQAGPCLRSFGRLKSFFTPPPPLPPFPHGPQNPSRSFSHPSPPPPFRRSFFIFFSQLLTFLGHLSHLPPPEPFSAESLQALAFLFSCLFSGPFSGPGPFPGRSPGDLTRTFDKPSAEAVFFCVVFFVVDPFVAVPPPPCRCLS